MNERRAQPYWVIVNLRNKVFGLPKKQKKKRKIVFALYHFFFNFKTFVIFLQLPVWNSINFSLRSTKLDLKKKKFCH